MLYVWVEAIDSLAEHLDVVPDDMPWGRDIEVTDPDGNRIRLAQAHVS